MNEESINKAREYWTNYFNNNCKFLSPSMIPDIPVYPKDIMEDIIFPGLIKFGAIPKDKLEVGSWYEGSCRNASLARWDGGKFQYIRYKWGSTYIDTTPHFQDDDGSDFFIPIRCIGDDEELTNKLNNLLK